MVTNDGNALVLSSAISATLDSITVISLKNTSGEFFRKAPASITNITSQKTQFEFYLNESEGNATIVGLSLYGNGATVALGSGTEIASQTVNIAKDNTQSLDIVWNLEVK